MPIEPPKEAQPDSFDEMIKASFEAGVRCGAGLAGLMACAVFALIFLIRLSDW